MEEMGTSSLHGGAYDTLPSSRRQPKLRSAWTCKNKQCFFCFDLLFFCLWLNVSAVKEVCVLLKVLETFGLVDCGKGWSFQ